MVSQNQHWHKKSKCWTYKSRVDGEVLVAATIGKFVHEAQYLDGNNAITLIDSIKLITPIQITYSTALYLFADSVQHAVMYANV